MYLESEISQLADKLKVKVRYRRDGRIKHTDLIRECRKKLKEKCNDINDSKLPNIYTVFNMLTDSRYFRSLADFPFNQMLHFPREKRAIYCHDEIAKAIAELKKFIKDIDFITEKLGI